jgi:hypothetical protein
MQDLSRNSSPLLILHLSKLLLSAKPFCRFRNRKVARAEGRSTNHSPDEKRVQFEEEDFLSP